ncbi:uncharacterized protein LOC129566095 [Sitodiplosis mosellana]|uniref:uncharacterized protein LOC129566095 n=1 Tax=Sitodiplosis mosellana TaxID=263140 RepID=UPI002444F56C|nr:uncharacterized protein LOC129566095 [Sitodiplosis mosellana]
MTIVQPTLLDLNIQCLRELRRYLNICDIVSLAEAYNITESNVNELENSEDNTEHLTKSKFIQFAWAVQEMFLHINGPSININHTDRSLNDINNEFQFYVKLLRHFGSYIKELNVIVRKEGIEAGKLFGDAIQTYCRESLVSIKVTSIDGDFLSNISQPFPNVETLKICGEQLGVNPIKFNKWFPKLRSLEFGDTNFTNPECIEHHFPQLTRLVIQNQKNFSTGFLTCTSLGIALHLNPQLESLRISDAFGLANAINFNKSLLVFIKRKLPNLRRLQLISRQYGWRGDSEFISIDSLTRLKVVAYESESLMTIPVRSNQMTQLHLKILNNFDGFDGIMEFVKKNATVYALTISAKIKHFHLNDDKFANFISGLKYLKTLAIEYYWQDNEAIDAIVHFLSICSKIKRFDIFWWTSDLEPKEHDIC